MPEITSINPESAEVPKSKLIDREIIDGYCESSGKSVYELLLDITEIGSQELSDFMVSQGKPEIENKSPGVLHGSPHLFNKFEPRVSKGGGNKNKEEKLVYASDDPDYSIFMGVIKLRSGMASVGYYSGKIRCSVTLDFVNGDSELSDGYVYVLDNETFVEDSRHHFTSPVDHEPMMIIPVKPTDMQSEVIIDTNPPEK